MVPHRDFLFLSEGVRVYGQQKPPRGGLGVYFRFFFAGAFSGEFLRARARIRTCIAMATTMPPMTARTMFIPVTIQETCCGTGSFRYVTAGCAPYSEGRIGMCRRTLSGRICCCQACNVFMKNASARLLCCVHERGNNFINALLPSRCGKFHFVFQSSKIKTHSPIQNASSS